MLVGKQLPYALSAHGALRSNNKFASQFFGSVANRHLHLCVQCRAVAEIRVGRVIFSLFHRYPHLGGFQFFAAFRNRFRMGVDKLALSVKSGNKHPRIVELFQPAVERRFVYRHQPLCSGVQSLVDQTDVALKGFSLAIRVFKTALKSGQLLLQCRRVGTRLVALAEIDAR